MTKPLRQRLVRVAQLASAALVAAFGVLGTLYGIWGPLWPAEPEIHPRDPSSLVLPFTIKNASGLAHINSPMLMCGVDFVYAVDTAGHTLVVTEMAFNTGVGPSMAPGETVSYTCNASDLLQTRSDGSLSFFGSSSKILSDHPIVWKPPFRILKMCVWVGGDYRWMFHTWNFISKFFQWPAAPDTPQWIEGPIAYAGRASDPFFGLKKPDSAVGMRGIFDDRGALRPHAFDCSDSVHHYYGLVTGPGRMIPYLP